MVRLNFLSPSLLSPSLFSSINLYQGPPLCPSLESYIKPGILQSLRSLSTFLTVLQIILPEVPPTDLFIVSSETISPHYLIPWVQQHSLNARESPLQLCTSANSDSFFKLLSNDLSSVIPLGRVNSFFLFNHHTQYLPLLQHLLHCIIHNFFICLSLSGLGIVLCT